MNPLTVLLSQALVAFTIELDNAFEAALMKTYARPFLASYAMWSNFLRFVPEGGTPVKDVIEDSWTPRESVASTVGGMERWGYLCVDHDPSRGVPPIRKGFGSARGVKDDTVIYRSMVGDLAYGIWDPLAAEIEERWCKRLGRQVVDGLRGELGAVIDLIDLALPRFYPQTGGGWFAPIPPDGERSPDGSLPAMLSRVLHAFTIEHERDMPLPLPLGMNVLRVSPSDGIAVSEIPLSAGVSKEAAAMSITWLERAELVSVEADPRVRGKMVRRTDAGRVACDAQTRHLAANETSWGQRYPIDALRERLEAILALSGGSDGPLSAGLVTPEGGWRSKKRYAPLTAAFIESPASALPHHPMVLHRGGWPDGS